MRDLLFWIHPGGIRDEAALYTPGGYLRKEIWTIGLLAPDPRYG
jgi:hypothetical protein